MLSIHLSLAAVAVAALMLKPRRSVSAAIVAAAAALDIAFGARVTPALAVVAPLVAFLTAALTLSALIVSSGLADRAAVALARNARGNGLALYALVCGLAIHPLSWPVQCCSRATAPGCRSPGESPCRSPGSSSSLKRSASTRRAPQRPARERLGRLATRRRPARLRRHNRTRRRCGALAAPQGSVATIIAADLAGPTTPPLTTRRLAPLPTAALLAATLPLKATL